MKKNPRRRPRKPRPRRRTTPSCPAPAPPRPHPRKRANLDPAQGTLANSAQVHPAIIDHDAIAVPLIRRLRSEGASWAAVARSLQELIGPPSRRYKTPSTTWSKMAAWRIGRRHGID